MSRDVSTTFVFSHVSDEAARDFAGEMLRRYPLFGVDDAGPLKMTTVSISDMASASDAARMALEATSLSNRERVELALEVIECSSWADSLEVFTAWGLVASDCGELVASDQAS